MIGKLMTSQQNHDIENKKLRGLTLIEAMLALSIGAMVFSSGVYSYNKYNNSIMIKSAAGTLSRLTIAAEQYADDHFEDLVDTAPQKLNINVLAPYFGNPIHSDAFRTQYHLSTRQYTYTVPDPASGAPVTKKGLQILVVGEERSDSKMTEVPTLRAEVANTAGAGSGFISNSIITCRNAAGTADRAPGNICGAYGAYSFDKTAFPASNLSNAAYVSLVTKTEKTNRNLMLHRYDFNDEELNTMHTAMNMNNKNINNVRNIAEVDHITFDAPAGNEAEITTQSGPLKISTAAGNQLALDPGNNTVIIGSDVNKTPVIASSGDQLQLGETGDSLIFGTLLDDTISLDGINDTKQISDANLFARDISGKTQQVHSVNSLHGDTDDPLRLQNFNNGEVIIGKRVAYTPDGSTRYDIADGKLIAQTISLQDIDCADCGGSLSNILPKWRQMGTYFIKDLAEPSSPGTAVPKPNCGSRRKLTTRDSTGQDAAYDENGTDTRYEPKIIIVPKKFGIIPYNAAAHKNGSFDPSTIYVTEMFNFTAEEQTSQWIVRPEATSGWSVKADDPVYNVDKQADPSFNSDSIKASVFNQINPKTVISTQAIANYVAKTAISDQSSNGTYTSGYWYPDNIESLTVATALAMTYCHFTGGPTADPTGAHNGDYQTNTDLSSGYERIE